MENEDSSKTAGGENRGEVEVQRASQHALEQIREILFGADYRELERRVVRVDNLFGARQRELEQEARRRIDMLEAHIRRESEAMMTRLEAELNSSSDALRRLAHDQREALSALEEKLGRVEEASSRGQRELRHEQLEQAKTFLDELQRLRKDLMATIREELGIAEGELAEAPYEPEEHGRH